MTQPKWLLREFVLVVHEMVLAKHGGMVGVRDEGLLESALSRPVNKFAYESGVTLHELAASYSYGLAMNHPFVDGNKRTALMCGFVFLEINDRVVSAPEAETVVAFESLAAGELSEAELALWYEVHTGR